MIVNNKQDLLQQLHAALLQNDHQTLKILLEDQCEQLVQQFRSQLTDEKSKQSFDRFVVEWRVKNQERKNMVEDEDKIRKINANLHKQQSENEEDIIQKQMAKKKPLKLQQKFGYDFYGNIKCLMTAYGDHEPKQQSVKMIHSQAQILCENFIKFIVETEVGKKMTESLIKQNIELVFKQEVTSFEQITKQYKKVTKSAMKKQELEQSSSEEESNSFPQEEDSNQSPKHMIAGTVEESQFFANLTKFMNEQEYEAYSSCRSVNFIQSNSNKVSQEVLKKFIKFLDEQAKLLKPQMRIFQLLSFVCCRIIRKFIFEIIRSRNQGKLKPIKASITVEEIKKIGNQQIQQFQNNLMLLKEQKRSQLDKAREMFVGDLKDPEFQQFLPKKYAARVKTPNKIQQIWKQNHHYQLMWTKRLKGEKQIQKMVNSKQEIAKDKEQVTLKSEYAKYIIKNWNFYHENGRVALWRKYFTQDKIEESTKAEEVDKLGKPNKKVKLESLKN